MGAPKDGGGAPISVEAAREIVLAETPPVRAEPVSLDDCFGRVAAQDVPSAISMPAFDNSAMDGYALRSVDTGGCGRGAGVEMGGTRASVETGGGTRASVETGGCDGSGAGDALTIVDESRAGHPAARGPAAGEAVRISTGAMLPPGADAVLPLEHASERDGRVLPGRPVLAGENVRRAGEDFREGEILLTAGRPLGAAALGLLASAGLEQVRCARRPRVAIFTSGDELATPGRPLAPGQIYDSNTHSLRAMARAAGAEPVGGGRLPDDRNASREAIAHGLSADMVLIAGGVSVGRHDHVKGALADLGVRERFWRVALRPGGPAWFGTLPPPADAPADAHPTLVFGLPGNPVSAMVTFRLFAHPALQAMLGLDPDARRATAVMAAGYRKPVGRSHYLRCRLELHEEHGWLAHLTREQQGSHVLSSMLDADALAVIPAEVDHVAAGERVRVELL